MRTSLPLVLILASTPAIAQTRVRPMGELRADSKGVQFSATFNAASDGKVALDVNERTEQPAFFASSHCTAAADGIAAWADSTTRLIDQQVARPNAPEKVEYRGPELPSEDCVIRVDRTVYASASTTYSLVVLSRSLTRYASAAVPVTYAQALAFIGRLRGTAAATLSMTTVAPGLPDNPTIAADTTPTPTKVENPYFEFQVEKQATPIPDSPHPQYPDTLRSANVEGEVLIQFVVDTSGRVEPGTVKVLKSTHPLFTKSVKDALVTMRFSPAEIAGRKVRQLVQMPFVFSLNKAPARSSRSS